MSQSFLYERITKGHPQATGTLAEPEGTPEPRFALQGAVYWMRALSILVADIQINWTSMRAFFACMTPNGTLIEPAANTIFEQLLMSLHHLSALHAMVRAKSDLDLVRIAIMAWYYGIYCVKSLPTATPVSLPIMTPLV